MPAIRRSSLAGKIPRDLAARQPLNAREGSHDHAVSGHLNHQNALFSPDRDEPFTFNSTSKALRPLQSMASRIGDQVEDFAKRVDQWQGSLRSGRTEAQKHKATITLVQSLGKIANSTVTRLEKQHGTQNQDLLAKGLKKRIEALDDGASLFSAGSGQELGSTIDENLQNLRHWQAEADTWELLRLMIEMDFPEPGANLKQRSRNFADRNGRAHTYTTDQELWERFCLLDDVARERKVVLEWLERTAANSESDIEDIVEQLESAAGQGKGTWSHGWLNTREAIKGRKRMMLPSSSTRSDLVTEMDPDAATRQGKRLEKEDQFHERSLWLACWEMLRQGTSWAEIREWFAERNENWRSVSLGLAYPEQQSRICLGGPNSGALWRRMCYLAATNGASKDDYERAVYGLLSGDVESVDRVCRSWDDFLYARYNSLLINRWDSWLHKNFPERVPAEFLRRFGINAVMNTDEEEAVAGAKAIDFLKGNPKSRNEAAQPIKQIQGSILAKTFQDLLYDMGIAVAITANADSSDNSRVFSKTVLEAEEASYALIADENALRIVAHAYIIFRYLGLKFDEGSETIELIENVLVCYIDLLRVAGQVESIPTYCAELSTGRAEKVLGRMLLDVLDTKEQKLLVDLMMQKEIDVVQVLIHQYIFALSESNLAPNKDSFIDTFDILEETKLPRYPKQRIRRDFGLQEVTADDTKVVRSAEWFMHIPGHWDTTFIALTEIMKLLLLSGRYSAVIDMAYKLPFKPLSISKSSQLVERAIDVFDYITAQPSELTRSTRSGTKRASRILTAEAIEKEEKRIKAMQQISLSYYEMLQLAAAIDSLREWSELESELDQSIKLGGGQLPGDLKTRVQASFDRLNESMEPLLNPQFLTNVLKEEEASHFKHIRYAYLPSLILAYNSALHCSAVIQTRDHLLRALELANTIAAEENAALADCFIETNRMSELVTAFALNSKTLLQLNEARNAAQGGKKRPEKKKRGWEGETVEIWDVERSVQ